MPARRDPATSVSPWIFVVMLASLAIIALMGCVG